MLITEFIDFLVKFHIRSLAACQTVYKENHIALGPRQNCDGHLKLIFHALISKSIKTGKFLGKVTETYLLGVDSSTVSHFAELFLSE